MVIPSRTCKGVAQLAAQAEIQGGTQNSHENAISGRVQATELKNLGITIYGKGSIHQKFGPKQSDTRGDRNFVQKFGNLGPRLGDPYLMGELGYYQIREFTRNFMNIQSRNSTRSEKN